jgi:hypothetical protein
MQLLAMPSATCSILFSNKSYLGRRISFISDGVIE